MSTRHVRKIGSVNFTGGGRETLEIDRAGVLLGLSLRLKYTVTNGASAAVGPLFQTLARLIQRAEIIVGGSDTIWSVSGATLAVFAQLDNLNAAKGMDDTVVLTGSATATTYDVVIPLPLTLDRRAQRRDDCALDMSLINQAVLAITWGPTDCSDFYTTPNSAAISSVTCSVEGEYLLFGPNEAKPSYLVRAINETTETVTATSGSYTFVVDRGSGLLMRRFLVTTLDADVGDDAIINDIQLSAGSFNFQHRDPVQLRAANMREFELSAMPTGVLALDETFFGSAMSMINTGKLTSNLEFVLDVTKGSGTTLLRVTREMVRPLQLAAGN